MSVLVLVHVWCVGVGGMCVCVGVGACVVVLTLVGWGHASFYFSHVLFVCACCINHFLLISVFCSNFSSVALAEFLLSYSRLAFLEEKILKKTLVIEVGN